MAARSQRAIFEDAATADLAAEAQPLARPDPLKVDTRSLVPPGAAALLDQLDNSKVSTAEAEPEEEVATLDFVGDDLPFVEHKLRFPFTWEGVKHEAVTVRQLTTMEVGKISGEWSRSGKAPMLIDIYAVMTGLPARVLRALPDADGSPVMKAGYDFLPLSFRGEDG